MRFALPMLLSTAVLFAGCKTREEKLAAAEEEGNLLVATKAKALEGFGKALGSEGRDAAKVLSAGTGEVVKAAGAGFDESLEQVKLVVHPDLQPRGLAATRAAIERTPEKRHSVAVYVIVDKPYSGPIELRAYDAKNQEIGRTKVALDEKESTARYVDFAFDPRTPLLTAGHFELR